MLLADAAGVAIAATATDVACFESFSIIPAEGMAIDAWCNLNDSCMQSSNNSKYRMKNKDTNNPSVPIARQKCLISL
jgi:hypothetical protein